MSRVSYDNDYNYDPLAAARWDRNSRAVFVSKRGQAILRDLEAALLALPEKRLVEDTFWDTEFIEEAESVRLNACVLGAYARYKGLKATELSGLNPFWDEPIDANETADAISQMTPMTFTMAWNLVEQNDEYFGNYTPEQRYDAMLDWIRSHLR